MRDFNLFFFIACFSAALFSFRTVAYAEAQAENADRPVGMYRLAKPVAIQSRKFEMPASLVFSAGYIPTDSFNKGIPLAVAYRRSLASYLTWEMLSFAHNMNQEASLKQDIRSKGIEIKNVGLGGRLDYPRQIYMTGLHYSPVYSKGLALNSHLTYSETSLFFGAGSLNFNETGYKPMIAPGLASRFYFSPNTALNTYIREYFFLDDERGLTGIIDFGIAFELRFGGDSLAKGSGNAAEEN